MSSTTRIALASFFAGAVVVGGIFLLAKVLRPEPLPEAPIVVEPESPATATAPTEEVWVTYQNDIFGFSIEHPASWKVAESNKDGTPMISLYKPGSAVSHPGAPDPVPPFTHWNNATHVSVFPSGIPTEGVVGLTQPSTVRLSIPTVRLFDYLAVPNEQSLEPFDPVVIVAKGVPWATFVGLENPPVNWKPWGFLWAGVALPDQTTACFRNGEHIKADSCDPLAGDEIVHIGTPNAADRALEERVLESFRFVE